MKYRRQAGGKDASTNLATHRGTRFDPRGTTRQDRPHTAVVPAAPAQFCVSGLSVVHRKPVQFVGLK